MKTHSLTVTIGATTACHSLSLGFETGQVWSVLGRNGVGKSTLLKTLAGLRTSNAGSITIDGDLLDDIPRKLRAQTIGILFQEQDPTFPATVLETVLTGRHPWLSPFRGEEKKDIEMALNELSRMDLEGMEHRTLDSLSGGERRRVDLAALILQNTRLLLLDEPVNHLDLHYQVEVLGRLINNWRDQNRTVIMVMHDINLALRFSDHLLLLFGDGECAYGSASQLATEQNFSRLYGYPLSRHLANGSHFFIPA
jgi:iron complex transport system ATP-binding protein